MSYKILEKNGVEIENTDGGAFNNFAAGGRDGIVGGVLSECALTTAGSAVGISPGLMILHGIRIKVTAIETLAISSVPLNPTSYQIIAQVTLASNGDVDFSFFIRTPQPLVQNALYQNGEGTYQAELASFTHNPDGTISDLIRTMDTIYGSGGGEVNLEVGTVTTETIAAGLDAEFNVDVRHEDSTNKTFLDFDAKIPRGESGTDAGAVHFNEEQTLTDEQKQQARENIDAASTNGNFPDFHAGYAEKDEQGNPFPTTYAKATIVPVRWNGGYWSSYGGQSAKAGDLALIIDNTGSTAYQKGCLYKVSSASGSSMSLSPTKIAGLVSSMAVNDGSGTSISDMFRAITNTLQDECVTISQDEYPIQLAVRGSIENKNILVFNDSSGSTKKRFAILSFRMLFDLGNAKVMSGTTIATHNMTLNKTHRCFGPIDYNDPVGRCIVALDINPDGSIKIYFSTGDNTNSQSFRLNSMNFDNVVIIFDEGEYL